MITFCRFRAIACVAFAIGVCTAGGMMVSCAHAPGVLQEQAFSGSQVAAPAVREGAQTYFCPTDDGWRLALHRFVAPALVSKTPVILCHDIGFNSAFWDVERENSFARYLSAQGFDVWTVDLRGAGESTKPGWLSHKQMAQGETPGGSRFGKEDWTIDDIIHLDVPAVLRFVCLQTHQKQVRWIGHGLGASIMAGFLVTHDPGMIKDFIAIGMPLTFPRPALNDILLSLAKQKDPKQLAAVFNGPWRSGHGSASASGFHVSLDELFYHMPNMETSVLNDMRRNTIEDVPPGVLEQLQLMIRSGEFLSSDRRTNYAKGIERVAIPTLWAAGRLDNLAGLVGIYETYSRVSSTDKTLKIFERANGCSGEYGHNDLVVGKTAPAEVYPPLAAWLKERS